MTCKNCGAEIRDGDRYCSNCGMEIYEKNYNPENKPLKRKFLQGEYWDEEEDFDQQENVYEDEKEYDREYYEDEGQNKREYYYKDYEEPKKSSGLLSTFLILLIALVAGFIIGFILFSDNLQLIPWINMG